MSIDGVRNALVLSDARQEYVKENYVSKFVMDTAKRAVELTRLNASANGSGVARTGRVHQRHVEVPIQSMKTEDPTLETVLSWTAARALGEWESRYARWKADVYDDPTTLTPTEEQAEVLRVVHRRVIKEEYDLAGERPPGIDSLETSASCDVAMPLLGLVHGLSGSG